MFLPEKQGFRYFCLVIGQKNAFIYIRSYKTYKTVYIYNLLLNYLKERKKQLKQKNLCTDFLLTVLVVPNNFLWDLISFKIVFDGFSFDTSTMMC